MQGLRNRQVETTMHLGRLNPLPSGLRKRKIVFFFFEKKKKQLKKIKKKFTWYMKAVLESIHLNGNTPMVELESHSRKQRVQSCTVWILLS